MTEGGDTSASPDALGVLRIREIAVRAIAGITAIMVVMAALAYAFREPLVALSERFVDVLGGFGVALGFFLPDAFTIPMPNDAFTFFGLFGGIPFWEVVAWGSAGTLTGGLVGFGIGRLMQQTRWFQRFLARRGAEMHALVSRYGTWALLTAALTPIPYSIACWASGAVHMPLSRFLLVSLARIPRVAFYLWLMELGFVSFSGGGS